MSFTRSMSDKNLFRTKAAVKRSGKCSTHGPKSRNSSKVGLYRIITRGYKCAKKWAVARKNNGMCTRLRNINVTTRDDDDDDNGIKTLAKFDGSEPDNGLKRGNVSFSGVSPPQQQGVKEEANAGDDTSTVETSYLMINNVKYVVNNLLYYNPDERDPETGTMGVMQINNKNVKEGNDTHSWTLRTKGKRGGCRPRSYPSTKIIDDLNPIIISNAAFGDVVEVEFNKEVKNFVFFASKKSECPLLREIHQCYAKYRFDIARLHESIPHPDIVWQGDHLAGGMYLPCGFALRGGTKKSRSDLPFIVQSACFTIVKELFSIYAKILGLEARVIHKYFPNEYDENKRVFMDGKGDDCIFPSPIDQQGDTNDSTNLHWCLHQVALRIMGGEQSKDHRDERRMAWHVDQSDVQSNQLLTFVPISGDDGRGGHVPDSDLMVFEHARGGKCFRLRTSIADTVVFILMNSGKQLHGSAMESINGVLVNNNLSARFIAYGRDNLLNFIRRRIDGKIKGHAYQDRKLLDHIKINREDVKVGDIVTAKWGAKKELWFATLIKINGKLHFSWHDEEKVTLCGNRAMYSKECHNVHPSECRHCNPSTRIC